MTKRNTDFTLPTLDDLFSSQAERDDAKLERVQLIPLDELRPFKNHPFKVQNNEELERMIESIRKVGAITPALARPLPDGGYELISGHRRLEACRMAGLETMPVIVRDMSDDEAVIAMVDANLQREHILPSEKAFAYKMKLEAMNRQGQRTDLTSRQVVGKLDSADLVSNDESGRQVQRYIRLTHLIPELLDMVDEGKIAFTPAVEFSYLQPKEQKLLLTEMEYDDCTPNLSQAQRLKELSRNGGFYRRQTLRDHGRGKGQPEGAYQNPHGACPQILSQKLHHHADGGRDRETVRSLLPQAYAGQGHSIREGRYE